MRFYNPTTREEILKLVSGIELNATFDTDSLKNVELLTRQNLKFKKITIFRRFLPAGQDITLQRWGELIDRLKWWFGHTEQTEPCIISCQISKEDLPSKLIPQKSKQNNYNKMVLLH